MAPLCAERILSYQPMGVAVVPLPKYFCTNGDSPPQRRRCSLAWRARMVVSSRARVSCAVRVALQDEWMGKEVEALGLADQSASWVKLVAEEAESVSRGRRGVARAGARRVVRTASFILTV